MSDYDYWRVRVEGSLATCSPLHIGSGTESSTGVETSLVNDIVKDSCGNPYIPASTLRGLLRTLVVGAGADQALFGTARQKKGSEESGEAGRLRIRDLHLIGSSYERGVVSRTSIDPLTLTAKEHHLSSHEVVPAGSRFSINIEIDRCDEGEVKAFLGALDTFDGGPDGVLGKGKGIGQGRMVWSDAKLKGIGTESLRNWLKKGLLKVSSQKKSGRAAKEDSNYIGPDQQFEQLYEALTLTGEQPAKVWDSLSFKLLPEGPLLINDTEAVARRELEAAKVAKNRAANEGEDLPADIQRGETTPKLIAMSTPNGRGVIPGSTLKGWLRGHCRRILLSLNQGAEEQWIDSELLAPLFGSTEGGRGCLMFEDALVEKGSPNVTHQQTFNAIDRFTGGVKEGALYSVEAHWPQFYCGRIYYHKGELKGWMKALLLYALRDAMEGDLVLGWGKGKGYGRLLLHLDSGQTTLAGYIDRMSDWRKQLSEQLKKKEKQQ